MGEGIDLERFDFVRCELCVYVWSLVLAKYWNCKNVDFDYGNGGNSDENFGNENDIICNVWFWISS